VTSPASPAGILVVDDEAMARESLCALLAKENYQVWETGEGDKVESMVRERRPDVVLLDLRLPGKRWSFDSEVTSPDANPTVGHRHDRLWHQ